MQGETDLPPNVRVISLGKERGVSRLARAIRFGQAMAASISEADGVLAHMSPTFAIAAAPFAKLRHLPLIMWYTHRHVDFKLRLATALCDAIVTASLESFRLPTPKLKVLGHGIDPEQFFPSETRLPTKPPLLLAVGRLSPIKRYELLIAAVKLLRTRRVPFHCAIAGEAPPGGDSYAASLRTLAEGQVEFLGAVPHEAIPLWYHRSALAVNLCPTGGLDKAVLEALFCARPVVVTNQSFAPLLGEMSEKWLVKEEVFIIAATIESILANPAEANMQAVTLMKRATAAHGLERLAEKLVEVFASINSLK